MFGEYQSTEPSRFLDEIPPELVERIEPARTSSRWEGGYETRNPYGRRASKPPQVRETATPFAYEDEDQSRAGVRVGMRVRHRQFGVGTVVAVEDHSDDFKITVRFAAVGTKKLIAKFAGLSKPA